MKKLFERKLDGLHLVAMLIDGIHLGRQVLVVALGIEISGTKHILGLWQGATENTAVVKDLLEDLVARGLHAERRYWFVIDGAKALRAGIERVSGNRAEVQRCQLHKRRNVKEYLPNHAQGDYDRRIRNAYAMTDYAAARAELEEALVTLTSLLMMRFQVGPFSESIWAYLKERTIRAVGKKAGLVSLTRRLT